MRKLTRRGILAEIVPLTFALTDGGDIDMGGGTGPRLVSGAEAAKAELISIFNTEEGEWPHNHELGIAYNDAILGKFFDETAARALLAEKASSAPSVSTVQASNVSFVLNAETRKLSVRIAPIYTIDGDSFDFVSEL